MSSDSSANHSISQRVQAVQPSLIRQVFDKRKPTSINLGLGQPAFEVPDAILQAGLESLRTRGGGYTANAGLETLREAIAENYRHACYVRGTQNVAVTCGSQEALAAVMAALLDPEDEVIVCEPAYPGYKNVADMLNARVVPVSKPYAARFTLVPELILQAVTSKTKLVIVNNPCNPTGQCDSREALQELVKLAERYGFWILSDEIYADILYTPQWFPLCSCSDRVIVVSGLSKSLAMTGFRLGFAVAPEPLAQAIVKAHAQFTSVAPTLSQYMAEFVFKHPQWLHHFLPEYTLRKNLALAALQQAGFEYLEPQGAFYVLVKIPEAIAERVCHQQNNNFGKSSRQGFSSVSLQVALWVLEQADVVVTPGAAFGKSLDNWLRLSFACSPEEFSQGVERLRCLLR